MKVFEAIKNRDFYLLQEEINRNTKLANATDEMGISALLFACYCQFREGRDLILQHRESLDIHEAAAIGNVEELSRHLANDNAMVSIKGADGFYPLGLACFFGNYEAAKKLIEQGAEVNQASANDFVVAPIHSAVSGQHLSIVDLLLNNGADANVPQTKGIRPLHQAAHVGNVEIVKLLLAHGAERNLTSDEGLKAIDFAQLGNFEEVVVLLD